MAARNKIAIITGGSRGLGRSAALKLAADGVDSIITYRTREDRAAEVVEAVAAMGRRAVALPLDTARVDTFDAFAGQVRALLAEHWGRETLDFLVNNAGNGVFGPFSEVTVEDFDSLLNVHFRGVFFLTQRLLPVIADGGRIVNLSSGLARFVGGHHSAYAAMKGAVEVLTRNLAGELGPRRITANIVAPGPIGTDFQGGALRDDENLRAGLASVTALGRVGEPDEVGAVIAALLREDTGWINGQRIEVSGGTRL
ncbi:SDR family NAD(P)-dependent oxidoreductase [Actinoalloteichus hymeniacidonis]|uniref:SDR family oxidoreductase n=1 Tax=Actinoalloteichus hymeniacidonis TaxID=340345 RepID=A0AAC9HQF9_9PSEU|nr:SDR family oxidoreductase [Actinoalloteichus hymeniacidonis]AOS63619.1 dehydrogenase of unknown specificity, short-chain alcohol dehydrogenase like [Actinoalloteichus hymeniacidonis]MBB5908333.1 NAD(P)-dependent dehydrogenase (short-subunit alcohol dehydrogenase family) [Actinoalloteichus hymeniacidonis]